MSVWQLPSYLQCLDQLQHALPRSTAIAAALIALVIGLLLGVWWRDRHGPPKAVAAQPSHVPPRPLPRPAPLSAFGPDYLWTSCHEHRRAYLVNEGCPECKREAAGK